MSSLDLQEQEQVEALKAWWKENGNWVLGAVVVGLLSFSGIKFWKSHQASQAAEAGKLYMEVLKQASTNDAKRISDAADALVSRYGSSAYAPRAQMLAAQASLQSRDIARTKVQLQWVIEHATETGLQDTARLKLASVLLDEKKYDEALQQLDAAHPESFTGLFADLRGDVLSAQGKVAEARAAYQQAYDKTDAKSTYRNLIQLKLDGLGSAQ
ncbi:MAG: tetratricopeptide repeat protein [Gammaproteobacteria bacterium]|nr:tetratricopeptide repeat protein [Gammaproteobacteria bacterium]MBU1482213.1 tetratricopeptide repeat protein [Gammaproteobacteria bacterium]